MRLQAAALAVLLVTPSELHAQWTQGAFGKIWVKSAVFIQQTNMRFDELGVKEIWDFGGESDARALFTDIIVGIRPNLDFWLQVPFFDLRFKSTSIDTSGVGFGDMRGWVRWGVTSLHSGQTPIALRVGAKAPIGDAPIDAQLIPVGDGQWDVDAMVEIGHSFWPAPAYAELWLGYRWRFENTEQVRVPGNEVIFLAEFGAQPSGRSLLKVTFDGLRGQRWRQDRVTVFNRRRISTLQFAGAYRFGPIWPEIGVRLPVSGREFPAGAQFVFGASTQVR